MKRFFFYTALLCAMTVSAQSVRVLSDTRLGEGCSPRFSEDGQTIYYLADDAAQYPVADASDILRVDNEDLHLNLYRNGVCTRLTPHGDNNYIWSSLSPDRKMILFHSNRGTAVCDLNGNILYELGLHVNAPVWFGNDYVVSQQTESDGYEFTAASLSIQSLDGSVRKTLTPKGTMALWPSVNAESGRVAYQTINGDIHLLQLNLTDLPISRTLPSLRKAEAAPSRAQLPAEHKTMDPSQVKIYINPGHGGHGSDDRNMTIYPFSQGDVNGFWESNSNFTKGCKLDSILRGLGMQTRMSRDNNEEGSDLDLDVIVSQANAFNSHFMLSIHSNAGNLSNMPLMLYSGKDLDDTHTYNDSHITEANQVISRALSTTIGNYLYENTITNWGSKLRITGDKTFARTVMGWSNGYGVLRYLNVPGLLSEGAMHDYIPETYRLMNDDYRAHESWQFARAFYEYFCGKTFSHGVIAGQVRDAYNKMLFPAIRCIKGTRDELNPLCGATVTLLQGTTVIGTYTTDQLYNGIFFFWNVTPGIYTLRAEMPGFYSLEKTVTVTANKMNYEDMMMMMERSERPTVLSYSPNVNIEDSIEVALPIIMDFSVDMLADSTSAAFSISPACEGTLTFSNSQRTMTFTPSPAFAPGVEYTVTLSTTACHPDASHPNHLAEPLVFKFRTKNRPHLMIQQTYPENGAVDIPLRPEILILTDLKLASVDKSNAAKLYFVESEDGSHKLAANSRIVKINTAISPFGVARFQVPEELKPSTKYIVKVASALVDTCDVTLTYEHTFSFTTSDGNEEEVSGELLETFEAAAFSMDQDKSMGVQKKSVITSKTYSTQGKNSNDISYVFSQKESDGVLFLTPLDVTHEFCCYDTIAFDIFGDLSYNDIVLEFSVDGDIHYVTLGTMDYAGWRQLSATLEELPVGVTYQWTGLKVVRGDNTLSWQGEFYIDRMIRAKGQAPVGVENVRGESNNAPRYFDLLGRPMIQPQPGILYITK